MTTYKEEANGTLKSNGTRSSTSSNHNAGAAPEIVAMKGSYDPSDHRNIVITSSSFGADSHLYVEDDIEESVASSQLFDRPIPKSEEPASARAETTQVSNKVIASSPSLESPFSHDDTLTEDDTASFPTSAPQDESALVDVALNPEKPASNNKTLPPGVDAQQQPEQALMKKSSSPDSTDGNATGATTRCASFCTDPSKRRQRCYLMTSLIACILVALIVVLSVVLTKDRNKFSDRTGSSSAADTSATSLLAAPTIPPSTLSPTWTPTLEPTSSTKSPTWQPTLRPTVSARPTTTTPYPTAGPPTATPTSTPSSAPSPRPTFPQPTATPSHFHQTMIPTLNPSTLTSTQVEIQTMIEQVTPLQVLRNGSSPQHIALQWLLHWSQYFTMTTNASSPFHRDLQGPTNGMMTTTAPQVNTTAAPKAVTTTAAVSANGTTTAVTSTNTATSTSPMPLSTSILNETQVLQRYAITVLDLSLHESLSLSRGPVTGYPLTDECTWVGVTCGDNATEANYGSITEIRWMNRSMTGTIPEEIRLLTNLEYFDIGENRVKGPINEGIFELSNLSQLYLHQNQLTGTLSESFSKLPKLFKFLAYDNQLTGPIPKGLGSRNADISSRRPLQWLSLHHNQLTGSIPAKLNWWNLFYLDLSSNRFTGTFPSDWTQGNARLFSCHHVLIDNNQFTGTLPNTLWNIGNGRMEQLMVQNNQFTGTIPGNYTIRVMMQILEAQNNSFTAMSNNICEMIVWIAGEMIDMQVDCDICICPLMCSPEFCYNKANPSIASAN